MSIFRLTDVSDASRESKEYWDKRVEEHWDQPTHGLYLDRSRLEAMDKRNYDVLDRLTEDLPEHVTRILECACGYGRYADYFDRFQYTGIDLVNKSIEKARALNSHHTFHVADMLTFDDGAKYDLIFMVTAWSSIEQKSAEVVKHLKTLLAPGGKIAIFEEDLYVVIDAPR